MYVHITYPFHFGPVAKVDAKIPNAKQNCNNMVKQIIYPLFEEYSYPLQNFEIRSKY